VLEKTLKRELRIDGRSYIVAISPAGLKLTLKGKRNGLTLQWAALISGDAALAVALNASLGRLSVQSGSDAVASADRKSRPPPVAERSRRRRAGRARRR